MELKQLFYPKSIALIGASNKPGKVGFTLANKLLNFQGKVFYVNVEGYTINEKEVYKSITEINEKIDLAILAIPAVFIIKTLKECTQKGIKNIIIISAVFTGEKRKILEDEIKQISKKNKLNILGPNAFGIFNKSNKLDCTFSNASPQKGNISIISQSGALYSSIVDYSHANNFGISKFISLGDMVNIGFDESLEYLIKDKETNVIFIYMESLRNGKEFMKIIKKSRKPIVVLKGGKNSGGKKATYSHTGSLSGEYEIYKSAIKQAGAYFVESLTESLELLKFMSTQKKPKNNKVLIITNAGGPGVLLTDFLENEKIPIAKIPNTIKFTDFPSTNPLDLMGDAQPERFKEVLNKIKNNNFYDILILILTPQEMTNDKEIVSLVSNFRKKTNKPVMVCLLGKESFKFAFWLLETNNIPNFNNIESPARLLKNIFN